MRNKNILLCPLSVLAFNFLFRWGFKAVDVPDIKVSSYRILSLFYAPHEFYNIHVFPGKLSDPEKQ
jgi:hypothetical protein